MTTTPQAADPADPADPADLGDAAPVRVTGPVGLVAAVPSLLGFHPDESLVLLCLSGGPRRRVGPVARVDLPRGRAKGLVSMLVDHARRHAEEVAVVLYTETGRRPPVVDELIGQLHAAGIPIMEVLAVRGGLIRPARSAKVERRHRGEPVAGVEDPQVQALTAAAALSGRAVLPDRSVLARCIAGPTGDRRRAADQHVDDALSTLPGTAGAGAGGDVDQRPLIGVAERALREAGSPGGVAPRTAAELAVLVCDVALRDALIAWAISERDEPWIPALIGCAAWTPDALAAPICSVLAVAAYRDGDGALAQVAIDRCLDAEPRHSLAHLMLSIMAVGLPPAELDVMAVAGGQGWRASASADQPGDALGQRE